MKVPNVAMWAGMGREIRKDAKPQNTSESDLIPLLSELADHIGAKQDELAEIEEQNGGQTEMTAGIWNGLEEAKYIIRNKLQEAKS